MRPSASLLLACLLIMPVGQALLSDAVAPQAPADPVLGAPRVSEPTEGSAPDHDEGSHGAAVLNGDQALRTLGVTGHPTDGRHVRLAWAPTPTPIWGETYGPGGTRDMEFVCPEGDQVLGLPLPSTGGDDPVVHGCPIRVYDTGYSFGNPSLVVNDADHRQAAFFALHGGPTDDGPSERSRGGLTHVTFTSDEQGLEWQDQPTGFPDGGGLGEYASGTMDAAGNVYAAYLWNMPSGPSEWDPVLGFFKGPTTQERGGMTDAYEFGHYLRARDRGNEVREIHLVRLDPFDPDADLANGTANETAPPADDGDTGEAAYESPNATDERVVAVWHERARDYANASTGLSGYLDAAWTHTGSKNDWTRLNRTEVIGPCSEASNAVASRGKVYVACVVDRGYQDRPRARVGDIDIWAIDVYGGNTTLVSSSGLTGGKPLLAVNEEGVIGIISQTKVYDDEGAMLHIDAVAAFGWYGERFQYLGNIGPDLRRLGGGANVPLIDADITAFTLTTDEKTAMIVYKEWHDEPQEPEGLDPDEPAAIITNRLTDYNKFFLTFTPCNFPIAGARMELGTAVDTNNAEAYQTEPGLFNDVQDGLYTTREGTGRELTYFAINDYGAVQYGAVVVGAASAFCAFPPPPPVIPPAIAPQALTVANPFTAAVGAAVAIPAIAMVAYLLTVKKRTPSYLAVEDD